MPMRRTSWAVLIGWIAVGSCGASLKKLTPEEVDAYHALQPFMSEDQEKTMLKFKTSEERTAWLKEQKLALGGQTADNLYELWYRFDAEQRATITEGRVEPGWTQDMMFMAWGEPVNRQRLTGRNASRSEVFNYRFEILEDGSTLVWVPKSKQSYKSVDRYQVDVYVDDGRVTELVRKAAWDE
jgi:hypothetical protein